MVRILREETGPNGRKRVTVDSASMGRQVVTIVGGDADDPATLAALGMVVERADMLHRIRTRRTADADEGGVNGG